MEEDKKIQIGIYKIDSSNEIFTDSANFLDTLHEKIKLENSGFYKQEIDNNLFSGYSLLLLYANTPTNPGWKDFLRPIVKSGQIIIEEKKGWLESFVFLLQPQGTKNIYAITGGIKGSSTIKDYIEDDFGINILSRIIKKEDKVLKSVKEKGLIGGILGSTKFFRNNYNFFENDSFGKIYQELQASIDKDVFKHFGFSIVDLKKDVICVAKSNFKINKGIQLEQIKNIIEGCEFVLNNMDFTPISINNVQKIEKNKDGDLIQKLENELYKQLWERYNQGSSYFDFDLCNKNYEDYLTASGYIVKKDFSKNNFFKGKIFDRLDNIDILFEELKEKEGITLDEVSFKDLINSLKIFSYSEEDTNSELTKGTVLQHIFGDILFEEKKYFLIDNKWFLIKDEFVKELDASCKNFINSDKYYDKLTKKWKIIQKENDYNATYIGQPNTLVLDRITPENIELCDILTWDDERVYLHHVKKGFGNTMRDLCSQIFIAASRLTQDLNGKKEFIEKVYEELLQRKLGDDPYFKKVGEQTNTRTKEEFLETFNTKRITFVLCVLDTGTTERSIKNDIEKFNSNIAKFSLQDLIKGMKGIDVDFRITQIFKE